MAVTSGFFNSQNGDRKYSAEQMSALFDALITDGVFANIGTAFEVKILSGTSSDTITVGIGRCWFNSTWLYNDTLLPIAIEPSEMILDRIDAVIIEINKNEDIRSGQIRMIKGIPSANPENPELVKSNNVYQYPLAYIYRSANSPTITQAAITNMIGTSACPYVTGILEVQTIDKIVAQWESEFNTWFDQIKTVLDGDVAANLANKVLEIEAQLDMLAKERTLTRELESSKSLALQDDNGAALMGATVFASPTASAGETITIQTQGASDVDEVFKAGDILTTVRTDLGDNWALCNGDILNRNTYTELSSSFPYIPDGNWKLNNGYSYTTSSDADFMIDPLDMAYGNGYYVCLAAMNVHDIDAFYTKDLNGTWTKVNSSIYSGLFNDNGGLPYNCRGIEFLNGYFIAYGQTDDSKAVLEYTTNPSSTWNSVTLWSSSYGYNNISGIVYTGGRYIVFGKKNPSSSKYNTVVAYSTSLSGPWTEKTFFENTTNHLKMESKIRYINGRLVAATSVGSASMTTNPMTPYILYTSGNNPSGAWTEQKIELPENCNGLKINDIIYANGLYIIIGKTHNGVISLESVSSGYEFYAYSKSLSGPWEFKINFTKRNNIRGEIYQLIYDKGVFAMCGHLCSISGNTITGSNLWYTTDITSDLKKASNDVILSDNTNGQFNSIKFIKSINGNYILGIFDQQRYIESTESYSVYLQICTMNQNEMKLPEISPNDNETYAYMKVRNE